MNVHLIDGTFELFRCWFGSPKAKVDGLEVGATRGLLRTLLTLVRDDGATHVAVAFDRVIESFRNDLFQGYKTGDGVEPELLAQFPLAEQAARSMGLVVWPMVRYEADDALATGALRYAAHAEVEQVRLCSPDKDLAQCVRSTRVVLVDRMRGNTLDEGGVLEKYGVAPTSIPDWLALVGDTADGIPGIPRWGAKSAATVLRRYGKVEAIPERAADWDVAVRGAVTLAENLAARRGEAELYRTLATLCTDVPITHDLEDLMWKGASRERLGELCGRLGFERFLDRVPRWAEPDPMG
ncbi:MAG: flap endonuclease [Myxococcales bacterium]|nr:flap endonuclease [Myxococcales bacterium]